LAKVDWLIKQWQDVLTKKQFTVSDILRYLIEDTIVALRDLEKLQKGD